MWSWLGDPPRLLVSAHRPPPVEVPHHPLENYKLFELERKRADLPPQRRHEHGSSSHGQSSMTSSPRRAASQRALGSGLRSRTSRRANELVTVILARDPVRDLLVRSCAAACVPPPPLTSTGSSSA